jgi:xanthine/uracil/vitamin C permease (AzgA family)
MKAKLLRFFALVFAVVGLVIFIVLYMRNVQGSFFSAMTNPFVIIMVIFPFLPAVVLSWKANKLEAEYKKLTQKK